MNTTARERRALAQGVPNIPREEWEAHPHYPSQTLLLGSHRGFRQISQELIASARGGGDAGRIRYIFLYWHGGMRGHENYEESKLFPFLTKRYGVCLDVLEEGHEALHVLRDDVFASLDRQEEVQGAVPIDAAKLSASTEGLVASLEAYDSLLRSHLAEEEEHVIPMLLSLSPEEFAEYTRLPLGVLLQKLATREAAGSFAAGSA